MTRSGRQILVAGFVVLVAAVSGCSSSGHTTSSTSAAATHSSAPAGTSALASMVTQLETRPATVPSIGPKITKPIPSGKTIDTINCGQTACTIAGEIIAQAAKTLGWTAEDIPTDGTPQTIDAAWQKVIDDKVNYAVDEGIPTSEIQTYITKAKANGTIVVGEGLAEGPGPNLVASIEDGISTAPIGTAMAAWVANDATQSKETTAGAVYVTIPDFPVLAPIGAQFEASMKTYCPTCSVSELDIGLTNIPNAGPLVISYLRAHANVKYVVFAGLNAFDAVSPAIRSAGLDVKIIGSTPSATSLTQLRAGTIDAAIAYPQYEASYAIVDVFARIAAGVASAPTYKPSLWLLTKENCPTANVFPLIPNVASQYDAVWGK